MISFTKIKPQLVLLVICLVTQRRQRRHTILITLLNSVITIHLPCLQKWSAVLTKHLLPLSLYFPSSLSIYYSRRFKPGTICYVLAPYFMYNLQALYTSWNTKWVLWHLLEGFPFIYCCLDCVSLVHFFVQKIISQTIYMLSPVFTNIQQINIKGINIVLLISQFPVSFVFICFFLWGQCWKLIWLNATNIMHMYF